MDNPNSSMDNPHPSMHNLSVDRHTSTDNPSSDKYSSRNLNSFKGDSQSQRSFTNKEIPLNDQETSSSRSILPPHRKWTKSHPFELIIGNAEDGVKTRSDTQN